MLNPLLIEQLESHGLSEDHLHQLLAICQRGSGRATWHIDPDGYLAKVEVTLWAARRDRSRLRALTQLLHKDH